MNAAWKPYESFGGLVVALSLNLTKACKRDLNAQKLQHVSYGRFWVLHALHEKPRNQSALCGLLQQSAPSMMEMLQRLQQDKLIKAKVSATDARKKEWSLTETGKRDYLKAREVIRGVGLKLDRFFASKGISASEIENVKRVLAALNYEHFGESNHD